MSGARRRAALDVAVALIAGALIAAVALSRGGGARRSRSAGSSLVTVDASAPGRTIAPGFLGLSIEFWAIEAFAGSNPAAVNPVLVQLIRNLVPGQTAVLRVGGVSTDQTWWPVAGVRRPGGVFYRLTRRRLAVMRALADGVGARLILGITFEADSRLLARAEARAMTAIIGRSRIAAFELGNEPELYGNPNFTWYRRGGRSVTGRALGYGPAQFARDFVHIGSALAPVPLAGPAAGAADWLDDLGGFIDSVPRLGVITVHRYPFEACSVRPASLAYPTVARMLSPLATTEQASGVVPLVALAHAHGLPLRVAEMNTIGCGNPPQVPNSFAEALWAVDSLFAHAQIGVDGVNIHTWPGATYQLFTFRHTAAGWQASVWPEYYGLLMFARAAPAGSRLVPASSSNRSVRAWATRATDGTVRVTLINDDVGSRRRVTVRVDGTHGPASVARLLAPSATARSGVTLGGQSFGPTRTGLLQGPLVTTTVTSGRTGYALALPPASAALLTLR